jgi:hypothetical protein
VHRRSFLTAGGLLPAIVDPNMDADQRERTIELLAEAVTRGLERFDPVAFLINLTRGKPYPYTLQAKTFLAGVTPAMPAWTLAVTTFRPQSMNERTLLLWATWCAFPTSDLTPAQIVADVQGFIPYLSTGSRSLVGGEFEVQPGTSDTPNMVALMNGGISHSEGSLTTSRPHLFYSHPVLYATEPGAEYKVGLQRSLGAMTGSWNSYGCVYQIKLPFLK